MRRNNKFKSGVSLAVMLGCMAIIACVFGYFVCSWFLDYVAGPEQGIQSVTKEEIVTEEKISSKPSPPQTTTASDQKKEDQSDKEEEINQVVMNQNLDQDLYTVQVGAFSEKENASGLVNKLQSQGFTAYITSKSPYRVQVGAFRTEAAAEELGNELESHGFPVYISQ